MVSAPRPMRVSAIDVGSGMGFRISMVTGVAVVLGVFETSAAKSARTQSPGKIELGSLPSKTKGDPQSAALEEVFSILMLVCRDEISKTEGSGLFPMSGKELIISSPGSKILPIVIRMIASAEFTWREKLSDRLELSTPSSQPVPVLLTNGPSVPRNSSQPATPVTVLTSNKPVILSPACAMPNPRSEGRMIAAWLLRFSAMSMVGKVRVILFFMNVFGLYINDLW